MTIWTELETQAQEAEGRSILSLFDQNNRFEAFSARFDDMLLDYSKTNLDAAGFASLVALLEERGVAATRDAMFRGDKINTTEGRAVLHAALRNSRDTAIDLDGENILPEVRATLSAMRGFAHSVRGGDLRGATGKPFKHIVNIGIGGSDLGPAMAVLALAPYCDGPAAHFVSNVDGAHVADVLKPLDPEETLVIIASKTFTTIETMTNAKTAIAWLEAVVGSDAPKHLAALSSATDKTAEFGIDPVRVFGFEDWVGGRYSLWGPIGLSIMLAIGPDDFDAFLRGAEEMDQHFLDAPLEQNLPAIMAMVGLWHANFCGYDTRAVLPYDQRLSRLPAYLQQLDMESNGKSVTQEGSDAGATGPIVWGEPGTNGQHAFYQLIHQGSRVIPCEFLLAREGHEPDLAHQQKLLQANCLAQSEALMVGRSLDVARGLMQKKGFEGAELERQAAHRVFAGNRPSVTLVYDKLTPRTLGRIIALYEHRVFVEGVVWGINSFDQWGVELGKELAVALLPILEGDDASAKDGSTAGLVADIR